MARKSTSLMSPTEYAMTIPASTAFGMSAMSGDRNSIVNRAMAAVTRLAS